MAACRDRAMHAAACLRELVLAHDPGASSRLPLRVPCVLRVFRSTVLQAREAIRQLIRRRPLQVARRERELNHGLAIAVGSAGASFGMAREVSVSAAALAAASPPPDIDGALRLRMSRPSSAGVGGQPRRRMGLHLRTHRQSRRRAPLNMCPVRSSTGWAGPLPAERDREHQHRDELERTGLQLQACAEHAGLCEGTKGQ